MTRYKILSYDPYLAPYERDIALRMANYADMRERLLGEEFSLSDFANGRQFYGFHQTGDGWVYREWAPNAEQLYLIGDFNGWNRESHPMRYIGNGNYEIVLPDQNALAHGMQVRVLVCTKDGAFDRIPLYITRTLQQPDHRFNGVIWAPKEGFPWTDAGFKRDAKEPIFIYECHVGMSGEQYHISTFRDFTD
ncbi:MAG: 1,4-alpha-glucan-branching enzyme, partial [Clostridiales bacterium]|nr:1,4-alpha-glucan-branching enzyme [Clostridiales bacterium]